MTQPPPSGRVVRISSNAGCCMLSTASDRVYVLLESNITSFASCARITVGTRLFLWLSSAHLLIHGWHVSTCGLLSSHRCLRPQKNNCCKPSSSPAHSTPLSICVRSLSTGDDVPWAPVQFPEAIMCSIVSRLSLNTPSVGGAVSEVRRSPPIVLRGICE